MRDDTRRYPGYSESCGGIFKPRLCVHERAPKRNSVEDEEAAPLAGRDQAAGSSEAGASEQAAPSDDARVITSSEWCNI